MNNVVGDVLQILDSMMIESSPVVVGVSWWPDSMCLLYCLQQFFQVKWYKLTDIHMVVCDHGTRKETKDDVAFVSDNAWWATIHVAEYYWTSFSESDLRQRRHQQFLDVTTKVWARLLFVWHHLDDRIETTMLNIARWADRRWILWMSIQQPHFLESTISLCRPLLWMTKNQIVALCDHLHIPYVIDPTNSDQSISRRNVVRHSLIPERSMLWWSDDSFYQSFARLYALLDQSSTSWSEVNGYGYTLESMNPRCPYRWVDRWYQLVCAWPLTEEIVVAVLHQLHAYNGITRAFIHELMTFCVQSRSGYKQFQWRLWVKAHGKISLYQTEKPFWDIAPDLGEQRIERAGEFLFGKYRLQITDPSLIWAVVRLIQPGDRYHEKWVKKRLLNNKIPVYWRIYLPVAVVDETIINVWLPDELWLSLYHSSLS